MARRKVRAFLALLGLFICAPKGHGAPDFQLAPKSLDELVRAAQVVVHGRVIAASAARDGAGRIWTTYTIEAIETLKDEAAKEPGALSKGGRFEIRQLGGTVGRLTTRASGVHHFAAGEEAILFTRDFGAGRQSVFNWPQAARRVLRESAPASKITAAPPASASAKIRCAASTTDLETFKAQIRALVKTQGVARASSPAIQSSASKDKR